MTDRGNRETGRRRPDESTLPDTGMGTGSDDEPPGAESDRQGAGMDRESLPVAGSLATPGPGPRRPAAEESDEVRRAASEEATVEAYRPRGSADKDRVDFVEPEE